MQTVFFQDKKSELMLMRCTRAYDSSCLQVILVFCSQKLSKIT